MVSRSIITTIPPKLWHGKVSSDVSVPSMCIPEGFTDDSWITPENVAEALFRCVFGAVCAETDVVRGEKNIFSDYTESALERLESGVDTGLIHPDVYSMWDLLDSSERKTCASLCKNAAKDVSKFPDVSSMNVALTNLVVDVDCAVFEASTLIPAVVQTRSGSAGIVPSIRGYSTSESALSRLVYPYSDKVGSVHVWDLNAGKIVKSTPKLFDTEVEKFSK